MTHSLVDPITGAAMVAKAPPSSLGDGSLCRYLHAEYLGATLINRAARVDRIDLFNNQWAVFQQRFEKDLAQWLLDNPDAGGEKRLQFATSVVEMGDQCPSSRVRFVDWRVENIGVMHEAEGEKVVLIDFGSAYGIDGVSSSSTVVATGYNIAPELLLDERTGLWDIPDVDAKSEVWSLMVTALHVLLGRNPHGMTPEEVDRVSREGGNMNHYYIDKKHQPLPEQLFLDLVKLGFQGDEVRSFVKRALAVNPGERIEHPSELLSEWNRIMILSS